MTPPANAMPAEVKTETPLKPESRRVPLPWWPALAFLVALALRMWRIGEMQLQFDEWLGGWHANPALLWGGSPADFARAFWLNAAHYVTSGQTVAWSTFVELLRFLGGPSVVRVRWVAALGGAFSAAVVAAVARRLFPGRPAALAASSAAVFGVSGIVFGQFADVYASALAASSLQLGVYFLVARPRRTAGAWLAFGLAAAVSQFFMYTQIWLTAGVFLAAGWEALRGPRPGRALARLIPAVIAYGLIAAAHLALAFRIVPFSESFRWYMDSYYPLFWRGYAHPSGLVLVRAPGYFALRLYDLFNYQLSLVFDPRLYQPLRWNWVSLPFLLVLAAGVICRVAVKRTVSGKQLAVSDKQLAVSDKQLAVSGKQLAVSSKRLAVSSEQLAVNSKQSDTSDNRLPLTAYRLPSIFEGDAILRLLITTLVVCMIANAFFLLPFGGVRQMVFLQPLFALFYGWLVASITAWARMSAAASGRRGANVTLPFLLCLLPCLPFALSLPGIYRDRVSRLDLSAVLSAIDRYQAYGLLASEQNIQILEMALSRDPRVSEVRWPGYTYPCDALDADFARDFPTLRFNYRGEPRTIFWVRRGYFPPRINRALWVDMHISRDSRFEGPRMKRFYPAPEEVVPPAYRILPLQEIPGNAPAALHQSIYWPPNSFYLYLIERQE